MSISKKQINKKSCKIITYQNKNIYKIKIEVGNMEKMYYRDELNNNFSMGENALIYYENILEDDVFNKIIISTILKLHTKGYIEINESEDKELIIKIKEGKEKLRISENFIYECLKILDKDNNMTITLNERNIASNNIIAKNKKSIQKLIIQEAMEDELIDPTKFKKKRKYFFRTLEILYLALFPILGFYTIPIALICLIIFLLYKQSKNIMNKINSNSQDILKKLKNKLSKEEILKYSSKFEYIAMIIEFVIVNVVYIVHFRIIGNLLYLYIDSETRIMFGIQIIEILIFIVLAIIEDIKFIKANVYADKTISYRKKLEGLKEYLKDYSLIEKRKAIEVYLWEDYLAFSVLLGINNIVSKEFDFNLSDAIKRNVLQYDNYENRYYYINEENAKIYVDNIDNV